MDVIEVLIPTLENWSFQREDHEQRAALVCLLTAALHHNGMSYLAGDEEGGNFCLPAVEFWAAWAIQGLATVTERMVS